MKTVIFFLFGVLLSQAQAQPVSAYYYYPGDEVYVHASSGLNMRDSASSKAKILRSIPYGSKVEVVSKTYIHLNTKDLGGYEFSDDWYEVSFEGKKGFVFGGYLSRFPSVIPQKHHSMLAYVQANFSRVYTSTFRTREKVIANDTCHRTHYYKEGICETINSCSHEIWEASFVFEDSRMIEIGLILEKILRNGTDAYTIKYDPKTGSIIANQDYTFYRIEDIGLRRIALFVEAG